MDNERETWRLPWPSMFAITTICSFLFSLVLKILDGQHSSILIKISLASAALWIISGGMLLLNKIPGKKKSPHHS